jgi:hypothetical protein
MLTKTKHIRGEISYTIPAPVPQPVNGVLVLSLPKLEHEQPEAEAECRLQTVGVTTHGERVGQSGSTISLTTTTEHQRKHEAESRL